MACAGLVGLVGIVAPGAGAGPSPSPSIVDADFHTLRTPPLGENQFELLTLSTLPDAVTGGDVLMAVRGLGPEDRFTVTRNGDDVTAAFARTTNGEVHGLVTGLREGENTVEASSHGRTATLIVKDHPISGPVISGPQQVPFFCDTEKASLGPPLDASCSAETRHQWFYRSLLDQKFHELVNPYAPYPGDVMRTETSDGRVVPYVARVETATINRGVARIAVLDDPAARGADAPFTAANWNRQVLYFFGSSAGTGYHQSWSTPETVLGIGVGDLISTVAGLLSGGFGFGALETNAVGGTDRLGKGDAIAHNTLTVFGVRADPTVNIETAMMMKEHINERYGLVERTVGAGVSGGSIQIHYALNNAPGLLDAGMHFASFPDAISLAMTVSDCGLLQHYYQRTTNVSWNEPQKVAVTGHNLLSGTSLNSICQSWTDAYFPLISAANECVPDEVRYDPATNPRGTRCSLQDSQVNIWGRDPATGFARRPLDNVGVQYGLKALMAGTISPEQFLDLNRTIGGLDADGNFVAQRHRMDPEVEAIAYRLGMVTGGGALGEAPVMDSGLYLDLIPSANLHESVRPFVIRERLRAHTGQDLSQTIWRGVLDPADGRPVMDQWLSRLDALQPPHGGDHTAAVMAARPASAYDRCTIGAGGARVGLDAIDLPLSLGHIPLAPGLMPQLQKLIPGLGLSVPLMVNVPEDFDSGVGLCSLVMPVVGTPRMATGMPMTDDIIKCQRKPVARADYPASLTDAQFAQLQSIFPDGVCDWSRPGVEALPPGEHSMLWPSLGGSSLEQPHGLTWRVARSRAAGPAPAVGVPATDKVAAAVGTGQATLPRTGGGTGPEPWLFAALIAMAAGARRLVGVASGARREDCRRARSPTRRR